MTKQEDLETFASVRKMEQEVGVTPMEAKLFWAMLFSIIFALIIISFGVVGVYNFIAVFFR